MNKNELNINENTRVLVLWPLMIKKWNNIIEYVEDDVGIKIKNKLLISPKNNNDQPWFDFVLNVYMAHRASDGEDTISGLKNRINKKINSEFFGKIELQNRKILILIYDIDENHRSRVIEKVKSVCGHDDQRVQNNLRVIDGKGHCFDQNILKSIVREKFKYENILPPHPRGVHYGRKRIAHTPESKRGSWELINFIFKECKVSEYK